MIEAVIFDMDGLLIDSEPLWHEAEQQAFAQIGMTLSREDCLKTTGMRTDEVVDYWYHRAPWKTPTTDWVVQEIVRDVVALIKEKGELKPGARQALDFVKGLGIKSALASSSRYMIIQAVLDKFDLSGYFELIYSAQEESYGKPHPAVYLTTCSKLGVKPETALAIEDSLAGVIAAKAAKLTCIAVPEEVWRSDKRFALADLTLNSLEDLNADVWGHIGNG